MSDSTSLPSRRSKFDFVFSFSKFYILYVTISFVSMKIGVGAIVYEEDTLKGDITIGVDTFVHPQARIIAEAGPIIIGNSNRIEARATIRNRISSGQSATPVQTIGNDNIFQIDSTCESLTFGNNNIMGIKAYVGRDATPGQMIGNNNVFQADSTCRAFKIGNGNVIERKAYVGRDATPDQIIGNNNMFQADSTCKALKVGNGNVIESKAFVGEDVVITNNCIIKAGCSLTGPGTVRDNTVIQC